jgi:hypothetical protein
MSLFDRWNRRPDAPPDPAVAPETQGPLGVERFAQPLGVTLLAIEDPFVSDVINGHASEAYKLGLERLITVDVLVRNTRAPMTLSVSGSKLHLFDDAHYLHEPLVLDSRARQPALVETLLPPGATARGWVTFCLHWDRQPARLQFFTGYLSAKVAVFNLPVLDAQAHTRRREEVTRERAEREVTRTLDAREREVQELEAKAAVARATLDQEARVRALEARAEAARAVLERAEALTTNRARYAQQDPPPDDDE